MGLLSKVKTMFSRQPKEVIISPRNTPVYWAERGKVYHTDKNCIALKRSSNIIEGTLATCEKDCECELCKPA